MHQRIAQRRALQAALCSAALLSAFSVCRGGEPTPALLIDGPDTLEAADYAQYGVRGLTAADVPKALVKVWPREKVLLIAGSTWGGDPFLLFAAKAPGTYLLQVMLPAAEKVVYAEKMVTVGGVTPPPPPPPPPAGKLQVVIVQPESGRTPAQAAVWFAKELRDYLKTKGHTPLKPVDLHNRAPGEVVPPELSAVYSDAAGKPLPRLYLTTLDGRTIVWAGDPPATVAAFIALLQSKGG